MMSPAECRKKAESCVRQADLVHEEDLKAGWLKLAEHWRGLAKDETSQATMARLFNGPALFD